MRKGVATAIPPWDTAVELEHVTKTFAQWQRRNAGEGLLKGLLHPEKREIRALDDVSFRLRRGEFAAYAGPNGAGKSTTMKLCCGMLIPTRGEVRMMGLSPEKNRVALMRRVGVLFGNRTELWWDHPVRQSFEWKRVVWEIPDKVYQRNLERAVELLELQELLSTFARELSLGQRMRAELALMLLHGPELILLDEPTLGLDVIAKRQMIQFLKTLHREEGVSILVTSHDMDDLEEMAERMIMIARGRIAYDGDFDGLRALAGQKRRLILTMADGQAPCLNGLTLLHQEKGVFTYNAEEGASLQALLAQVARVPGVQDVQMQKAPIEEVVEALYRGWKGEKGPEAGGLG